MNEIQERLFSLRDEKYLDFNAKLIPNLERDYFIGVRTPALRAYAKELIKSGKSEGFLDELPHQYYEENQLHSFILCEYKDFDRLISRIDEFLPYVNNWATCDQLNPKIFAKNHANLDKHIERWMHSDKTYTVRFALGVLNSHFLDSAFDVKFLELAASVKSDEYYTNIMIAWLFATALAKQYDATLPFIEGNSLDKWVKNKSIQKARESFRVSDDRKAYLNTLKV